MHCKNLLPILCLTFLLSLSNSWLFSQDLWQKTNGPSGGVVQCIALNKDGTLYAGSYLGTFGVIRSTDNGFSWQLFQNALGDGVVYSLLAGKNGDMYAGRANGVFKLPYKTDTWIAAKTGLPANAVTALARTPGDTLFAGLLDKGVYRSIDAGLSWTAVNSGLTNQAITSLLCSSKGVLYATTSGGGVFRSLNKGVGWEAFNNNLTDLKTNCLIENNLGSLLVGTETGGVFAGPSWTSINYGLPNYGSGKDNIKCLLHVNSRIWAGTRNSGIYRLTSAWTTWEVTNNYISDKYITTFGVNAQNQLIACCYGGGFFRTIDQGETWAEVNTDFNQSVIRALAYSPQEGKIFAGTEGSGVWYTSDQGQTWFRTKLNNAWAYSLTVAPDGNLYIGTAGGVYQLSLGGNNLVRQQYLPANIISMACNRQGQLFAGAGGIIWRSINSGTSWDTLTTIKTNVRAICLNNNETVFIGTEGEGVFRSDNNGDNWISVNTGLDTLNIWALTTDSENRIFAASRGGGIYRSEDNGNNWIAINTGLTVQNFRSLKAAKNDYLYAGSMGEGIFLSKDHGNHWEAINSGLGNKDVSAFTFDANNFIYAGTYGHSVFRSLIPFEATNPNIKVNPESLNVTLVQGQSTSKTLSISNVGKTNLTFTIAEQAPVAWLSESPISGTVTPGTTQYLTITFNAQTLTPGTLTANLIINSNDPDEATVTVPVTMTMIVGTGVTVKIDPSTKQIYLNRTGSVDVIIQGVKDLGSFEFEIDFTGACAAVENNTDVQLGAFLTSTGRTAIPVGPNIDNMAGTLLYGAASLGSQVGPNGDGILATIKWKGITSGTTTLDIKNVKVTDISGATIKVNEMDGEIVVSPVTNVSQEEQSAPGSFTLCQNYPNPFNAETAIHYQLAKTSRVTLRIFNSLGQEIRQLVDVEQAAGNYAVYWNGKNEHGMDMASAIYFYRLEADGGSFVETRKMLLLR